MPKTPRPSVASASSGSGGAFVLADVLDFLEKRHFNVPAALRKACPSKPPLERRTASSLKALESVEFKWALTLLSELKERERRALARFVEKRASGGSNTAGGAGTSTPLEPGGGSQLAAHESESDDEAGGLMGAPSVRGGKWPEDVRYTNDYVWGDDVPAELQAKYRPLDVRRRAVRPCPRTFAAAIDDADHPAYGECGLFARRSLPHGAWVIDYVGGVSLGANEDRSSDYVCDVRPAPS
jgi:hypothetical protein